MADESSPRPGGIRVLDFSTPRPPGEAPAPAPAPPAPAVPRGPAPVVGEPIDLSTGKPPSRSKSSRTNNPEGLRVVVQQTINLSTPKAEAAPTSDAGRSRRGTRPDGATRSSGGGPTGPDARHGASSKPGSRRGGSRGGNSKGGRQTQGGSRGGGSKGGRPRGGSGGKGRNDSRSGASRAETPRAASTGLADFLDPETLKRLRGE